MAIFMVYQPATARRAGQSAIEQAIFVRDHFSWAALAFGPFWLLARGLWWALAGYIILVTGLVFAFQQFWPTGLLQLPLLLALHLLLAFEATPLRAWTLQRRGYSLQAITTGHNRDDCERRYFAERGLVHAPVQTRPGPVADIIPLRPVNKESGVIGIFPRPGGSGDNV